MVDSRTFGYAEETISDCEWKRNGQVSDLSDMTLLREKNLKNMVRFSLNKQK